MMTEEELKDAKVRAKEEVTQWLYDLDVEGYHLEDTDPRLLEYALSVIANPQDHNVWEQLALRRFFRMVDKYGICTGEVVRFFTLYESLTFPSKEGMRCFKLTPVQAFQFASIFAFWKEGRRVVREACLYVPRKFSKTTATASLVVDDLIFGDPNAEAYIGANSQEQAKKCFDVIRWAIDALDPKRRYFTINEEKVKSKMHGRKNSATCLTASARTKDGLNASVVIMDEFSQAKDANLLNVLTTSMGNRDNPLTVIITTASDLFDAPFYDMLIGYKEVLLGMYDDDHLFVHLFEPDEGDKEDDPHTWHKVHPHLGITVNEDYYEIEYTAARRKGAEYMLAFRTKLLNVYAQNEKAAWIGRNLAMKMGRDFKLEDFRNRPTAMCSFDLSESDDFSVVNFTILDTSQKVYLMHNEYFFPEGALEGHPNENLYKVWAEKGFLNLCKGPVIDYNMIVEYIVSKMGILDIRAIGYDGWKAGDVANMLRSAGNPDAVIPIPQSIGHFTAPVESFEHGAKTGRIFINANPINYYCFANAVLMEDQNENLKPTKKRPDRKIDGVITCLMSLRMYLDGQKA